MKFFTRKEDNFLRKNYLIIPAKRMSVMLGRSESSARQRMQLLGLIVPAEITEKFKKGSQFKKGHSSFNKGKKQIEYMSREAIEKTKATRFKKGNQPHNTKEKDGAISIRYDHKNRNGKPYKYIRISKGIWYPLHQYKWELKNGKQPIGTVLRFKDGNTLNCTLKNLELISRKENMQRNTIHRYPNELKQLIRLNNKLKRATNGHKKQNI